jgi:outer membrane protein TolC
MTKRILFIIFLILVLPWSVRAEEITLELDEALAIALRDNRDILLKAQDVQKAKAKIAEAEAAFFPTLNFTATLSKTRGLYHQDFTQTTTQTTLKKYLYKGGEIINTLKYNGYKFEVHQALLDKTKLEVIQDVQKAFYTLMLANAYAQLNKGILENTRQHLDFLKARFQNGQASESDLLRIKESLGNVDQAYEASLNQVEAGEATLRNLLYLSDDVQIKLRAHFQYDLVELVYDEAFLKAMQTRPEIRQYEAQVKADEKNIEITKADNRPNIYASWDYYSRSHITATATRNWNDYQSIGLTFSWPIFDGWQTKAKVEQAIVDLKETRLVKEKTVKDIALELKNAYLDLKDAIAKIKSSQDQINLYKDTLLVTQDKYKAGIASSLDLNDVSLGYEVSLFNQKQAIYDYLLAKASFDKATGGSL